MLRAKIFAKLNFLLGDWQIEMREDSIEKTAFACPNGLLKFVRMPFGVQNAPGNQQRALDLLMMGLMWEEVLIYLGDIIVFGPTFEISLEHLEKVICHLDVANFYLKPSKCYFEDDTIKYLEHIVSQNDIQSNPDKTKAVRKFPSLTSWRMLPSIPGLAGYYWTFIKDFSQIARKLSIVRRLLRD